MKKKKINYLNNNLLSLKQKEFYLFFYKFIGNLIFRGKKIRAINNFDYIMYELKKYYKYENIVTAIYSFYLKLYPIFNIRYKRFGKNYQPIPKLAFGNIKNVLIFSWFLKYLKRKNNTYGINIDDIVDIIINTNKYRSSALNNKNYFYKRALSGKHFLKKHVWRRKRRRKN